MLGVCMVQRVLATRLAGCHKLVSSEPCVPAGLFGTGAQMLAGSGVSWRCVFASDAQVALRPSGGGKNLLPGTGQVFISQGASCPHRLLNRPVQLSWCVRCAREGAPAIGHGSLDVRQTLNHPCSAVSDAPSVGRTVGSQSTSVAMVMHWLLS